jgi:hypothetical protein
VVPRSMPRMGAVFMLLRLRAGKAD